MTIFYTFVFHNECDSCGNGDGGDGGDGDGNGNGNDPKVSVVPEPSNFALVATGWAVFLLRKRYFRS